MLFMPVGVVLLVESQSHRTAQGNSKYNHLSAHADRMDPNQSQSHRTAQGNSKQVCSHQHTGGSRIRRNPTVLLRAIPRVHLSPQKASPEQGRVGGGRGGCRSRE
jgi:hypothetical protein